VAKYVPGSVWQYAGRAALARSHGVPMRPFAKSLPIELLASACAAAAFSILLVGWWGVIAVLVVFALVVTADALSPDGARRAALRATGLYGATWVLVSLCFCLAARAFVDVPTSDIPFYAGAFAASWVVGLVAVYAPGGLGVREAVLVALLRGKIGSADALVVAAASRGVLTFVDLFGAIAGHRILRGARRSSDVADAGRVQ
jgi:uncharacterized membrane protein YbhN (UPF0104 family)